MVQKAKQMKETLNCKIPYIFNSKSVPYFSRAIPTVHCRVEISGIFQDRILMGAFSP